jgi:hypothetical protein
MHPTFSYWDSTDLTKIAAFRAAWASLLPNHNVLSDADVILLLERHFPECPEYAENYSAIGIAAAKSDIARYITLYDVGGFYLDVHFGYADPVKAAAFVALTNQYDVTLVDVAKPYSPKPEGFIRVINGLIGCARRHPLMHKAALCALRNVTDKRIREQVVGFEPYNIYFLTGPGLLNNVLFDDPFSKDSVNPPRLKSEAGKAGLFTEAELPFIRNVFKSSYSHPDNHWSERQRHELLFPSCPGSSCQGEALSS